MIDENIHISFESGIESIQSNAVKEKHEILGQNPTGQKLRQYPHDERRLNKWPHL